MNSYLMSHHENKLLESMIVNEVIDNIPIKQRIVLSLILHGFTQDESSKILGVTRAAIGATNKRALSRLKLIITEE